MKKFLLSIFAVLFAFAGVQAQEIVTLSFEDTALRTSFSTTQQVWEQNGITFTNNKASSTTNVANYSNPVRLYANSEVIVEHANTMTKIVFVCSGSSYATALKNSIGDAATASGSDVTVEPNSTSFTIAKLTGQVRVKSITVTYTTAGGETPVLPTAEKPVFNPESQEFNLGESVTVEISAAEGATIYYTTDGETPTEQSNVYENALTITETTTVKAIAVIEGHNNSAVAEATYTAVDPNAKNAEIVAKDLGYANAENVEKIKIGDYITVTFEIGTADYATKYYNTGSGIRNYNGNVITFTAAVGVTINSIVFTAAGTSYTENPTNLSSGTATIDGTVTTISNIAASTLSFTQSSNTSRIQKIEVTYSIEEGAVVTPVAPNAPVLPESTTFKGSMLVEITGIAADATVYYTTDESDPATSATHVEYTEPFEITATTTVKAVAVNEVGASEMATATYTLFVVEETTGYYVKVVSAPADWSGKYLIVYEEGTDAYVFNGKDEANGYVSAVTDGDVIKANNEIDAVAVTIATMEGGYSISTVSGYMYKTAYSNGVDFGETANAANTFEIAEDGVVITSGNNDDKTTFRYNKTDGQNRFRYYKSGQQPVQLYKYVEELPLYQTLTVTDAGYATLYLGASARIPSAVEAYTVTAVNSGWVSLTQVTGVIPANTGIIVKADAGDYKFFMGETATADVTGNLLEGSAYNKNIEEEAYVLGNVDGVVGLYKAKMTDGVWLNNANKAYLPASALTPAQQTAAFYGFDWNGTTGVEKVEIRNEKSEIYDLTGRRVENISVPGIYVVGGKKVLVK